MFGIITVIQYLVIARGAERVAEVGARFALDGMPGHQAAIDADLKAGVISAREAAQRRAELNERSSFHGAMDGAIKFVKGDAVAGLVITTINLAGGLAIGMGRMGYTWQESLDVYGRLTVGDGLLAQIPALLVSLAAGVLVSRVDRQREGEAPRWLQPPMLIVPATMLAALALVPGMPWLAFATTSIALLALAIGLAARGADHATAAPVEAGVTVIASPEDFPDARAGELALAGLRQRCADALGIDAPAFSLVVDPTREGGSLEVRLGERVLYRGAVAGGDGDEGSASSDAVLLAIFRAVMAHADALVDLQDIDEWIERAREQRPAVVTAALAVAGPLDLLEIVRGLLRERICLPPFDAVLGVVADGRIFQQASARRHWPEHARERLAGYWVRDLLDGIARLGDPHWVRPYPDAEEVLLAHAGDDAEGLALSLSPSEHRTWASALRPGEGPHVVLCTPGARPALARLLREVQPLTAVVSVTELERADVAVPGREHVDWVHAPI
jgi:flagellar biosynthesis component FlhA